MQTYLKSFNLPDRDREADYILSYPSELYMQCYRDDAYPFNVFSDKGPHRMEFEPITVIYGSNGSGKSTLLNIISEKLSLIRNGPFNSTPFFSPYLELCTFEAQKLSGDSCIIRSDDVFGKLLDIRYLNEGVDTRREELFREYKNSRKEEYLLSSLDDYDEFRRRNETKRKTKSEYTASRLPNNIKTASNGESAFEYFTRKIPDNALCLLDEPENSLSYPLQKELAEYIYSSARFFGTQFVISTHSPFFLSLPGAKIYSLDENPVVTAKWTELPNVRALYELFRENSNDF